MFMEYFGVRKISVFLIFYRTEIHFFVAIENLEDI